MRAGSRSAPRHRLAFYGALAMPFGAPASGASRLEAPPAALAAADRLLARLGRRPGRRLVALEPGARYGPAKRWPPERYGDLARASPPTRRDVVTSGTAATRAVEAQVARVAGPDCSAPPATPTTSARWSGCSRARGSSSPTTPGPMHLAAALGTPVLALFGATDPVVSAPAGAAAAHGRLYDPEPCCPCFLRECPVPGHPCLAKIPVERVLREAVASMRR